MKRILCICMVFCLVLAFFAGCGEKAPPVSPEGGDAVSGSPAPSPADAPKKAAFIPITVGTEFFQQMANLFVDQFTAAGYTAEYASPDGDAAKQIEIVENYVAMGYDLLVVYPVSGEGLSSAVKNAQDAGVKVIIMVEETETYDGVLRAAGSKIMDAQMEMAAAWVEDRFADWPARSVKCAAVTFTGTSTLAEYSQIALGIEAYSDKIVLETVYEVTEDSSAAGQAAAENIYTTNPDINLFLCVSGTVAYGVNNYYTAINCPVDDLSAIGVFGVNGSTESYAAVKASGKDEAVLRGIASVAGLDATIGEMLDLADKLFSGTLENPERDGKIDKITIANVDTFLNA